MTNRATIFAIKRFAVHDGTGIRTTVFFKGCPLRCIWCHNPEGLSGAPALAFYGEKCLNCFECVKYCRSGAHRRQDGKHILERSRCVECGECAAHCPGEALRFYPRSVTCDEILPELLSDRSFYLETGGGVTLSGGEALLQADFCAELLQRLKAEGIGTAVDTCGGVSREAIERVLPYTDIFLYDVKAAADETHRRLTGCGNELILSNLHYLSEKNIPVEIRIPLVPECNGGEIPAIAEILRPMKNITGVRVLPYHNYAANKYVSLGMTCRLPERVPTEREITGAENLLRAAGLPIRH